MKLFYSFLFCLFFSVSSYAQTYGVSVIGNLQTESVGLGLRAQFPISFLQISPQIAYYPSFNHIHESFIGLSTHIVLLKTTFSWYTLCNFSYNAWYNFQESPMVDAKQNNLTFELGAGVAGTNCRAPFFEYGYNPFLKDANVRIGLLFRFNCSSRERKPYNI